MGDDDLKVDHKAMWAARVTLPLLQHGMRGVCGGLLELQSRKRDIDPKNLRPDSQEIGSKRRASDYHFTTACVPATAPAGLVVRTELVFSHPCWSNSS